MTNETLLLERYGKSSKSNRKPVTILAVALLVIFFVWAIWASFLAPAKATPRVLGYEVGDAQHAKVRFSIDKPSDASAVCAVEVMNKSFAVVGYREVTINKDAAASEVFEASVNTAQLGVTGLVEKCWLK